MNQIKVYQNGKEVNNITFGFWMKGKEIKAENNKLVTKEKGWVHTAIVIEETPCPKK